MLKSKREQSPERDREQDREQVPEQVPRPSNPDVGSFSNETFLKVELPRAPNERCIG